MQGSQPRILHIITKLAVGGAQLNTLISTRDISKKGYHSDILTGPEKPSEGDLFALAEKWKLTIIIAPHLKRNISPFSDYLALLEIKKVIREGNYNIVHTHGSKARFLGRIAAASFSGVRTVQTAHGWPFYDSMNAFKSKIYVTLEKIGFNLAHINICVSPRDRDKALLHRLGHFNDYRVIRSGVEFDEFRAARNNRAISRSSLGISPDKQVIGSVMRFCPEKAPDIFVRVAAGVIENKPDILFVLVGDGPLRKQTENLISSMKLRDNFLLLGSRNDVVDILPAFDAFLITSRTEGLPRALLESLASGVPVVSTNVGGVHELVGDGRNGFLSDEGDIDSLVSNVNRILDFPEKTMMMSHVDIDLEPFSAKKMVDDLYSLYTKLKSPLLNVVFLCDDEPFNIPRTIGRIIRKRPFNRYTIISLHGHGSLKKPLLNIKRYLALYGCFGFLMQLFKFAVLKLSGKFMFPTRYSHSLMQTARREHAGYAALDRLNSKKSRDFLRSLDPDVLISVACPQILRKKTLAIPELGAWNVHSSLLPVNRGMLPTFWSLYNGDTPGVTLHEMVPELDAGGILIQKSLDCSTINNTSLHQLLNRAKNLATEVVAEGLGLLADGNYTLLPNLPEKATVNTFPSKMDIQRFRNMGGKITGIKVERPRIAISFDVEEWFQTHAARKWYPSDKWDQLDSRIVNALDSILQILDDHRARATFFFLGWIVERHPDLVHKIMNRGHEIGYHGYNHVELTALTREEFRRNLDRFLNLTDSLSIPTPVGFRAPSFSMKSHTSWVVDEIVARGFKYDSSIYPMFKLRYGVPEAPQEPFILKGETSSIIELPLASVLISGLKIPIAGGAYLRFYPGVLHRILLRSVSKLKRTPVLYFHPWEIDTINISSKMNIFQRIRQHHNSGLNTVSKLSKILKHYKGITLRELAEKAESTDLTDFSL